MKNLFFLSKEEKVDNPKELMRRFLDDDLSPEKREWVKQRMEESEEWRLEYEKADQYLASFKELPTLEPPERIWENIENRLDQIHQRRAWFPAWLYDYPKAIAAGRAAVIVLLLFSSTLCFMQSWNAIPNYNVVTIDEINGFGLEAETYVALHDLSGESAETTDSLVALYTTGWSE